MQLAIKSKKTRIKSKLNENEIRSLDLSSEKGGSSWSNAMPLKRYHFDLMKTEYRDGIALRYGWEPVKMPSLCACIENFTVAHALHCPKGGYTQMGHNERLDSFANFLCDVCHDVKIEPHLQPLQGENFPLKSTTTDDDARLDIQANELWESRFNKTYFDVKIFKPLAKSCPESSSEAYTYHESIKRNKYEQRITEVEIATSCPLVFACTSGAGPSASKALKQLASKLSLRKEDSYADIISYLST